LSEKANNFLQHNKPHKNKRFVLDFTFLTEEKILLRWRITTTFATICL